MIVIGEKINGTLSKVKAIIQERNTQAFLDLAKRQAQAGADYIDVNVATGEGSGEDEVEAMQWAVKALQQEIDTPLSIDSADAGVIKAGLEARSGRPSLINSVNAEPQRLREIIPLALHFEAPLVALAMDETGIPPSVEGRLEACRTVAAACQKAGIELEHIFFDPLVLPVSADTTQGLVTLETLKAIKHAFVGAKSILGISNVSYGLPQRAMLNAAFLHMAVFAGLDAAILDPTDAR
ncbi:MAG: methyltetrahydrofolate cobalamin methyltransferase, partial [Deltaproteobacteria bacterium]